ncbi:hypothetical protein [Roseiflexus sp.]
MAKATQRIDMPESTVDVAFSNFLSRRLPGDGLILLIAYAPLPVRLPLIQRMWFVPIFHR